MLEIDAPLVRRLVAEQLPDLAHLPVVAVAEQGNDNRTFRLGDELTVRLPGHERYVAGIAKEDRALPLLSGHLSTRIPEVVATGRPSEAYPHPFSVRRWLPGRALSDVGPVVVDELRLAAALGRFLRELRAAPTAGGPAGGQHSFFRGCHPSAYAHEVQVALVELGGVVDAEACHAVWSRALVTAWPRPPVWFHGDVAAGNLLVDDDGALAAVIDFGTCGVGDPACDLVIAWTHLSSPAARERFREAADLDADTWDRARGWALWKALVTLTDPRSQHHAVQRTALRRLLADV